MKLDKLTREQDQKITEYRDKYFKQATSTEPADRARAERAALRLAEIGGVKVREVVWVMSPDEGTVKYGSLRDSLLDSLLDFLRGSLPDSLRNSLRNSLRGSLPDSLRASLRNSLLDSLLDFLPDSLRGSLWDSLWDPLPDSLQDSGWLALYNYSTEVLKIPCSDHHRELLHLHNEIAASCFAVWIVPGAVILCERPETVKIIDGKLVGIAWRGGRSEG